MTRATITPNTDVLCNVAFDYEESSKEAVKALAGTTYTAGLWTVPILHLPTLKAIFSTMTVAPEVVSAYHDLLRRMLTDFAGSEHRKGKLSDHIAELKNLHAVGIAAVLKTGWKPTERPQMRSAQPVDHPTVTAVVSDPTLDVFLRGVKNAQRKADQKEAIAKSKRRKKKVTTELVNMKGQ